MEAFASYLGIPRDGDALDLTGVPRVRFQVCWWTGGDVFGAGVSSSCQAQGPEDSQLSGPPSLPALA